MAKIKYRQRMREIDRMANDLTDAISRLRQDIVDQGDDARVVVVFNDEDSESPDFFVSVYARVTTTY